MPFKMSIIVQSIVIDDLVYVGGGYRSNNYRGSCTVMKLDLQQDKWTKLPQYSAMYYALA